MSRTDIREALDIAHRVIDTWGDENPPIVVLARALVALSSDAGDGSARNAALEEAAKVADDMRENRLRVESKQGAYAAYFIAERIRALKQVGASTVLPEGAQAPEHPTHPNGKG